MKRLFTFVAALVCAAASFAQLSIWNGSADVWTNGAGTANSPYQIESAEQLAFIAEMVNAGVTTYENTYFKLMTNIDLNNLTWVPIGSSETNCFKGHFDGNNHCIYHTNNSLFQVCNGASVKRVNIEMSGLASYTESCNFDGVFYKGNEAMVDSAKYCALTHCYVNANIEANRQCGGFVTKALGCIFNMCSMNGNIQVYGQGSKIRINNYSAGIVAISNQCKYIQCSFNGSLYSYSNLYATYESFGISGGIVATSLQDSIVYCSALGIINKLDTDMEQGVGGIIGITSDITTKASCILHSFTSNDSIYGRPSVLFAYNFNEKFNEYFGDRWRSGRGSSAPTGIPNILNSYSRTHKTEAAMKSASFPIILNVDSTVFIKDNYDVNDGYPIYKSQVYPITKAADNISSSSAQLNGNLYVENADSVGFEYKEKNDTQHWYKSVTSITSNTPIAHTINNLTPETEYIYRLWAEKEGVRYFGDTLSLVTLENSGEGTALDNIQENNAVIHKYINNGQLYVERNGNVYTITGVEVK